NIAKHAQANRATVTIGQEDGSVKVMVRDDGRGFDVEKALHEPGRKSIGLFGIEERVQLIGGTFTIDSATGKGTKLTIVVPTEAKTVPVETEAV
ncbi:MAG: sensor histidine kinase, partial [Chloroflexi bacterium]|nr:sensor histidine kinase [Chloroflexota bacterium]